MSLRRALLLMAGVAACSSSGGSMDVGTGLGGRGGESGTGGAPTAGAGGAAGAPAGGSGGAGGAGGSGGSAGSGGAAGTGGQGGTPVTSDGCPASVGTDPFPTDRTPAPINTPAVDFMEGPVWIAAGGYLLFSAWNWGDDPGTKGPQTTIYKLTPPSTIEAWSPKGTIRSNGLAIDAAGDLVVAAHDAQEIARVKLADRSRTTIAGTFQGATFNSPNDLTVRKDGTIYFTDPDYQRSGRPGQPKHGVYRVATDGKVSVVDLDRQQPNGIVLSRDEAWLYVGGGDGKIVKYPVASDGSTGPGQPFAMPNQNIDGMTIDCAGNVYATLHTQNEIRVYAPTGNDLGAIKTMANVTNVAFGGRDRRTLYITTAGKLFALEMRIPGLPY